MKTNPALTLEHVEFSFGTIPVISDFSLSVETGSFTSLLGPSGCGKTTLLRLIAGFLEPSKGCIKIDGKNQRGIGVEKRKIGMVFQDYALFPHLTVEHNLSYGLKISGTDKHKTAALVKKTADTLGLSALLKRFPHELSGGQQQRVALGRALVLKPRILLMDEPLSSLDAKLRISLREELREIQQEVGITTVYVTHDQEEALSLSDTIAVLNGGRVLQHDSAERIYFEPADRFTASFIGAANFFEENDRTFLVRPEWFEIKEDNSLPSQGTEIRGTIISQSFLGKSMRYRIKADDVQDTIITADIAALFAKRFSAGKSVRLVVKHRCFL